MAGVHRLQHVQRFPATDLSNHNPIRAHTQRVAQQFADRHFTLALGIGWPAFKPDDVVLLDLELDGIFDGDDPVGLGQEGGKHIQ